MTDIATDTAVALVLGATGKTGRRLVPKLVDRGVTVRAASRRPGALDRPGAADTMFDWDHPETHGPALAGADAVYLITPDLVEDPTPVTGPFLERAAEAGVRRVVALTSMGVAFPHGPGSGRDKVEQQVAASGLEWTILRPGGFAQNFSEGFQLPGILEADAVVTATGDGAVAFVDADDIAAVAAAALTKDGHAKATYTVTGPEAITAAAAAEAIGRATGRTITHRDIPSAAMADILRGAAIPDDYAAVLLADMEAVRAGLGVEVTDVVERVTGLRATTFAEYAAGAVAAWSRD